MPTAKNSKIEIETGQTLNAFAAMADSGDHQIFTISGGDVWSGKSAREPDVRPNGITSGRNLMSPGTTVDTVKIAAFTAYSKGVEQSPSATSITVPRPTSGGYYKTISITMASDGSMTKVAGTENATQSEVRNAAGGPPYIPENDIEVSQVRVTSSTSAVITTDELYQVVGQHTEQYDSPTWDENNIGDGEAAEASSQKSAYVKFLSALPLAHTGGIAKAVFIKYYAPIFQEVSKALDFVPAENSHSVTSQEYYRGAIASVAESVGQGSFVALLNDGLTDAVVAEKNQVITVRQYPDENRNPYSMTQGKLGIGRTFPVANQIQAECTISAERQTAEFSS